jgi:hypothetical protein
MRNSLVGFRAFEPSWQKIIATKTQKLQIPRMKIIASSNEKQFRGFSCFSAFVAKNNSHQNTKTPNPTNENNSFVK